MLDFASLNYWAVAVAALINMVVGAFWYSPFGFGKRWTKLSGIDIMKMPANQANKAIMFVALGAIVQAIVLAAVLRAMNVADPTTAIWVAIALWVGFAATVTIGDTMYARRGLKFWWLNSSYFLVVFVINSVILAVWS